MMVMMARSSCQYQRGHQEGILEDSLMGMSMMMMVMRWWWMRRLWTFATPLTGSRSVPTIHTVAVLSSVLSQSASSLSAVGIVVDIGLPGWTAT